MYKLSDTTLMLFTFLGSGEKKKKKNISVWFAWCRSVKIKLIFGILIKKDSQGHQFCSAPSPILEY